MILGLGNDIIDIRRIEKAIERFGERFLARVFTATERAKSDAASAAPPPTPSASPPRRPAPRPWAPGSGKACSGATWAWSICARAGRPCVLTGGAAEQLNASRPQGCEARVDLSLTDDFPLAQAIVVISAEPTEQRRRDIDCSTCAVNCGPAANPLYGGQARPAASGAGCSGKGESMSSQSDANKVGDSGWRETVKIVVHALILAMIVRIFFYQPFNIPSGSMKSTLLVGDYLFVSKLSYGYSRISFPFGASSRSTAASSRSEPKRGDVSVFKLPRDNSTDYIKRVIGLPGDEIADARRRPLHQRPGRTARCARTTSSRPRRAAADPALPGDAAQRRELPRARTLSQAASSTTSAATRCRPATIS